MSALVQRPCLRPAVCVVLVARVAGRRGLALAIEDDHVGLSCRRRRERRGDAVHATGDADADASSSSPSSPPGGCGGRVDAAAADAALAIDPTLARLADPPGHADAVPTQAVAML